MKLLFVTYDFPFPMNSGGKSRAYHLMKYAASENTEVLLYSFTRDSYSESDSKELEKIKVSKIFTYKRKSKKNFSGLIKTALLSSSIFKNLYFEKFVKEEIIKIIKNEKIDCVIFESFYTSFYICDEIRNMGVKQIYGSENVEHMLYYDLAKTKGKLLSPLFFSQVSRIKKEESEAYDKSDLIFAVTEEEKEYIEKQTKTPVSIVPNGVDAQIIKDKEKKEARNRLLFVGNFIYFPNFDAISFFYKEVFLKIPQVTLTIVGKHQEKLPFLIQDPRVKNVEYIDHIENVYYESDVFVFPVRFGGGTNFKVLEAAACGTPIIAIPERVKGLSFKPYEHYIPALTAQEFITGINTLLEEKDLYNKISENAQKIVEQNFTWEKIGKNLIKTLNTL